MQTTANVTTAASARLADLQRSIGRVVKGKEDVIQLALTTLLARGHLLIEDVPGVGQDHAGAGARALVSLLVPAHPVYFRHAAERRDRHQRVQSCGAGIRIQARADLREHHRGRRNQPHDAENAIGAAGSDERSADHRRQSHAPAAETVSGARDAKSDRASRHVPAARIAARPLPDAHPHGLSGARQREGNHPQSFRRGRSRAISCRSWMPPTWSPCRTRRRR